MKKPEKKLYKITYRETLIHTFWVEAEDSEKAREDFLREADNGEYDFSYGGVVESYIESIEEETEERR